VKVGICQGISELRVVNQELASGVCVGHWIVRDLLGLESDEMASKRGPSDAVAWRDATSVPGDGVMGDLEPFGGRALPPAGDLDGLASAGEAQAADVSGLEAAGLDAAVPGVAGVLSAGTCRQGGALTRVNRPGWLALTTAT
jgi:hypothetical protein